MSEGPTTLHFQMLGELEVTADGIPVALGGAKQRSLLALLLLGRGRAISSGELSDAIWAGTPPSTAHKSIQVYVSGLRKALGEDRILTRAHGYELVVAAGEADVDLFDAQVEAARGAVPVAAATALREALALVRGRPLAGLALEPWAAPEIGRLEEKILSARESRIEADLALGRHREVVPELEALTERHPYREHLLELTMLALYRSGRQADALAAYRRGAERVREELGLDVGRPLHELEAAILRQDAELDPPRRTLARRASGLRRRPRMLVLAAAAVALVVVATVVGVTRDGQASLASVPPGIAIISAESGSLVAHVSTDAVPFPSEVVTGGGSFWVWSLVPFSLVQVEPATGKILHRVGSPFAGDAGWFHVDGNEVWFTGDQDLVRVDIGEGRAVDRYRMTSANHRLGLAGVTRCAGSLWVADNEASAVLRVDARTGRILARIPSPYPAALACDAGALWATSNAVGVAHRIDAARNVIVATAHVPATSSLAVGGGYAWTSSEVDGEVYKLDRRGRIAGVYETGDGAHQVSFGSGKLWVANQDAGTVTGIDAATGAITTHRFGHPVQSVAVLGSRLLVELNAGLTFEDRISALEGKVARVIVPIYVFDPPDPAVAQNPWVMMTEDATCSMLMSRRGGGTRAVRPDLATGPPAISADRRTYSFTVRPGVRFAPPSNAPLTAEDVRASIERALSAQIGSDAPGIRYLGDIVGARELHRGTARHASGIRVAGNVISFTLTQPSDDLPQRLALPFFCTLPADTPRLPGGVEWRAPPSAGPYYMSDHFNGEYMILARNPNYRGPRPAQLDAIAFREGISPEHAVARVRSGAWDAAILTDELLAPGGLVARRAADNHLRTEELRAGGTPDHAASVLHALVSARLGCDTVSGGIDFASLCLRES